MRPDWAEINLEPVVCRACQEKLDPGEAYGVRWDEDTVLWYCVGCFYEER